MQYDDEFHVIRDANGNPDVRYYLATAQRLRAETTRAGLIRARRWLGERAQRLAHALHLDGGQPTPHH
ncbi:MAG: hypothetical protein QNJ91_08715 [Gammaproteobacteria bacterium]|nr:hypothetical protein [Gammaproteobacteria bacterium]